MLESGSFNVCMNVAIQMIAMLDCLEIDIEVLNIGIETVKSNDCREVLGDNRDTNRIFAAMQEGTRLFCKGGWKFIDLFTQSISGLCWVS